MRNVALVALVALASATLACGGVDEGSVDDATEAEGELRTSGIKSIEVHRSTGFVPPPPRGQCRPSGRWEYDFTSQQLTGDACLGTVPVPVNNTLSDADHQRVRVAVSKVRATKRPAACPTDMPINSLTVKRAQSEAHYVDQRAACGGGSTPVKEDGLRALVELMEELSEPPPANASTTYQGTLVRTFGIGGENTGYSLGTSSAMLELALDSKEAAEFVSGRKARVTGKLATRTGVEIPVRTVVDVEELLVCPAPGHTFNCMPIVAPGSKKYCANQQWITSNCSNVDFVH